MGDLVTKDCSNTFGARKFEPEMRKIFDTIVTSGTENLTYLKELVDGFFQSAENHNQMQSSVSIQSIKDD